MIVRRGRRTSRFTIIDNDVIEDRELSFRALGLLTYILSKPDDWSVESNRLAAAHQEGRDAVRSALTDLELAGYIKRDRVRRGSAWVTETVVYDRPSDREIGNAEDCSGDWKAVVGKSGAEVPSTDTKDLVPKGTATTSGRRAKGKFSRLVEEEESPGLGTDPDRIAEPSAQPVRPPRNLGRTPALPERIDYSSLSPAADAADTPYRCALRFKQLSIKNKKIDPANLMEFSASLKRWYADGLELDVLKTMVDIFAARPESYMTGRQDIPWRAFLNAREKLQADASKVEQARSPERQFGSAYARAAAR